ncbi:MAG: hypothetical protein V2I43_15365, partial [Parvularcula sp.]|nr:hypothetical protein [Parvularcula sp.]
MITKYALPAFVVGAAMAGPANALEYETVIEHPNGDISAIYSGAASIETREVGTAPIPGRRNNKRCIYSVSLTVDRNATVG